MKNPRKRWRKRSPSSHKKSKRKRRRNEGREYFSDFSKKKICGRVLGPSCTCKENCRSKLNNKEVEIFNKFWDLGSFDIQNAYLFGCIKINTKKRCYPKKTKRQISSRKFTASYTVKVNGMDVRICKTEFMSIHGLQSSRGRLNNIVTQVAEGSTTPKLDKRGKHKTRPNKLSEERVQLVKDHINSIPKYQSHYSRAMNDGKVYLGCDLSISRLYGEFYLPWCTQHKIEDPVSQDAYRRIFCRDFNIGFVLPKSDTCKTCDESRVKIEALHLDGKEDEAKTIENNLRIHQIRAKAMQNLLKSKSEEIQPGTLVITFDLQQALPIPKLTTGPAFYCRKLWLYNFGVHDCTNNQGYMFVWGEETGKRGSDEMCSALVKFLSLKPDIENLIVFTDNCPGQNKNWAMMALWLQLIKEKRLKEVTHYFLISGHTHLPSDRDFALIEKRQKKVQQIYDPGMWLDIIQKANKKNPFQVTLMTQNDILNISSLLQNVTKAKKSTSGAPVDFASAIAFKFNSENSSSFFIKHAVNEDFSKEVRFNRVGRPAGITLDKLTRKYLSPLKINRKKLEDVNTLLPYIPPIYHHYYNRLSPDNATNTVNDIELI